MEKVKGKVFRDVLKKKFSQFTQLTYTCHKIRHMKKLILSISFGFLFQVSFSQTNYVITVKGDTLRGEVKILSYDLVDRAQLTIEKKKKSFTALEVKAVFLNNQIYHSIRHDNRYMFMTLLKSGYLSLYGFRIERQFTYDGRYLLKRDGEAIDVPNLTFKKSMQEFLKDCMSVRDQIKSGELGRKNLDTLITLYNSCIDKNTQQAALANAASSVSEVSLPALETLKGKVEKSTLSSKQDILDLIKDIDTKVKGNQPVPNYLIEGLKGYLVDTEYKEDLEKLIDTIKKN